MAPFCEDLFGLLFFSSFVVWGANIWTIFFMNDTCVPPFSEDVICNFVYLFIHLFIYFCLYLGWGANFLTCLVSALPASIKMSSFLWRWGANYECYTPSCGDLFSLFRLVCEVGYKVSGHFWNAPQKCLTGVRELRPHKPRLPGNMGEIA